MRKLKKIIFTAAAAVVLAALCSAEIYNMRPFGTGAYAALALTGVPIYVIAPVYLIVSGLMCTTTAEMWGYLSVCLVFVILKLVFARFKRKIPLWAAALAALASFCAFIYAVVIKDLTPLNVILSFLFSLLFMLVTHTFVQPLFDFDGRIKLTEIELVCGCCLLCAFALATSRPVFGRFSLVWLLSSMFTLTALYVKGAGAGLVCAVAVGCGASLNGLSPVPLAVTVFAAALSVVFLNGHRLLNCAGYMLGFAAASFVFEGGNYLNGDLLLRLLSALIGVALYAAIPSKRLNAFKEPSSHDALSASLVASLNDERRRTGGRINETAEIFGRMSEVMSRACFDGTDLSVYAERLLNDVCGVCPYRENCECRTEETMRLLVGTAFEDGHTSVGGLPKKVLDECRGMAQLINKTNGFVEKNKEDEMVTRALKSASALVSEQLSGARDIMYKFAAKMTSDAEADVRGAKKFEEELTYNGTRALGAFITRDGEEREVSVFVRNSGFDDAKAAEILRKMYKRPFRFLGAAESDVNGFLSARFHSGAAFDVTFGVSCVARSGSGKSGDSYSFTRIGADGFMMALSDGMGSGEGRANEISETALSLVENYYRAGFDSDFILASVNRFLSLKKDEAFSAMDALILDLSNLRADIIKVGSPQTLIKREGRVALFGGGSLPLGAVEELSPYIESVTLALDDIVVMASDGVCDCFESGEMERLVEKADTLNPQTLSRTVLDEALKKLGGVQRDDMTVLCGRIYKRM
jgi:stage II sporulation protein E